MDTGTVVTLVILMLIAVGFVAVAAIVIGGRRWRQRMAQQAYAAGAKTLLAEGEAVLEGLLTPREQRKRPGRGVLVLTETHLNYREFFPPYTLEIPLRRVGGVETTRYFLEKERPAIVMAVDYQEVDGSASQAGFRVTDTGGWAQEIRKRVAR